MKSNALIFLVSGILTFSGCSQHDASDKANIRSNYVAFRAALLDHDLEKARTLMSSHIQSDPPREIEFIFGDIVKSNFVLTSKSHIKFDMTETNRAWLWPNSGTEVGTAGFGFTQETNGWRINGEFMPVMH